MYSKNTATPGCDGNPGSATFMHANAWGTETTFYYHNFRFYRRISTGKNEGGIYESDKEGVINIYCYSETI